MIFKKIGWIFTLLFLSLNIVFGQKTRTDLYKNPEWTQPEKPFRIAGNLYYVGTYDLSSYLIVTDKGNILINTGTNGSAPIIRKNIEALGFRYSDTKIILTNQVHYDHVGGIAQIKKETKARLMIESEDVNVMEDGGQSDFVFGGKGILFQPAKVDRILHDKDTIVLGQTIIQVLHHPGHTKGACSYLFATKDKEKTYKILIANMPTVLDEMNLNGMKNHPNIAKDFAYTLDTMPKIKFDLWFAAHASQYDFHKKHLTNSTYNPEAFRDQLGYENELSELRKSFQQKLEKDTLQKAKK